MRPAETIQAQGRTQGGRIQVIGQGWSRLTPAVAAVVMIAGALAVGGAVAQSLPKAPRLDPPNFSDQPDNAYDVAVLGGLDKITARVSALEAPINQTVEFGSLSIAVRACFMRPPEEPPETTAFLEISDIKPDQEPVLVFSGWMFASSPAVSALEHPVYDVWVTSCKMSPTGASSDKR